MLVALVVAGFGIERSGLLGIRSVEVVGAQALNPRVLSERSGLKGQYLLTADFGAAERTLKDLPMVADAKVERAWPAGVRIHITEQQGWALWESAGRRYVVDGAGHVLQGIEAPPGSPVVIDARNAPAADAAPHVPGDVVRAVRALSDRMPKVLGLQPGGFRFEDVRGLVVTAADGHAAIFGDGGDLEYKLSVWKALLLAPERGVLPRAWIDSVDLRYGDHPSLVGAVVRPAAPPAPKEPSPAPSRTPTPAASTGTRLEPSPTPPARAQGLAAGDAARRNRD